MSRQIDLLHGKILPSLTGLAVPIMATSLVQMAYNMTDMIWIGRIGSNAVAAVGAAGMYMWLSNGLAALAKMGGQVKTAHALGADRQREASEYAKSALWIGIILGILYGLVSVLFAEPLIGFFRLNSTEVITQAENYLVITCGGIIFSFINQIFTGIMTAMGNSRTSFLATCVGLVINIFLDPVLIFGIGPVPKMGVTGAAIATVAAQAVVMALFLAAAFKDTMLFHKMQMKQPPKWTYLKQVIKIGLPTGIQSMIFTGISMVIARMIASWGDTAVAVQKVGSQIESISWMTADGFAAAVNSFVAQNYGAEQKERVKKGFWVSIGVVSIWGIFCSILLICFPELIFKIFIPDTAVLPLGVDYLRILGISEFFMCIEITTAGAFSGLGKTIPPSVVSILFTSARIPLALILSAAILGLNGVWWSISISSIFKGVILFICFYFVLKKLVDGKEDKHGTAC